jgi:hypothetical protein
MYNQIKVSPFKTDYAPVRTIIHRVPDLSLIHPKKQTHTKNHPMLSRTIIQRTQFIIRFGMDKKEHELMRGRRKDESGSIGDPMNNGSEQMVVPILKRENSLLGPAEMLDFRMKHFAQITRSFPVLYYHNHNHCR